MTDNLTSRRIERDGNFNALSSFGYEDIKEGTVEVTGFTQPGGAGTAITAITLGAVRGYGFSISNPVISDTDITGYFAGVGLAPTAARSFDINFDVNFSQVASQNLPSATSSLELPLTATGSPGVTVNSVTNFVSDVTRVTMKIHVILEIWGASDAAIYTLLASLLSSSPLPRINFVSKIAKLKM